MENALLSNFHFFTEILRSPYIRDIFRKKWKVDSPRITIIRDKITASPRHKTLSHHSYFPRTHKMEISIDVIVILGRSLSS